MGSSILPASRFLAINSVRGLVSVAIPAYSRNQMTTKAVATTWYLISNAVVSGFICHCNRRPSCIPLASSFGKSGVEKKSMSTDVTPVLSLLTFDLDDTLFPIAPVVAEANDAMISSILKLGYPGVSTGDVVAATKSIRKELSKTDTPITYTDLRIQAIQLELERCLERLAGPELSGVVDLSVSRRIFDVWLQARHEAAERYLFDGTVDMLEEVSKSHPGVVIGAVTNGRGNPLDMPALAPYFAFTISGEDAEVFPARKPHRGIFDATLTRYKELTGEDNVSCWIHVGDDLANDVGASAVVGARAIWFDMERDSEKQDGDKQPSWSTASKEEIERRKQMAQEAEGSVSKRIATLAELPGAIGDILLNTASCQ